ncbi:MAG: chemotaxis protein CheW [Alphaproteobacteria bacterium]|jgi:two-component system chemotaxis sensor kinase CheA|nr:hybrid sensor histidine kinase/response regulator [Candidatus Jidaibacter sp.]
MDDITIDFLNEAEETLADVDNYLVQLEINPNDSEYITKIFRIMHTIKGTSGFLGLNKLEKITHYGENILNLIRDNQVSNDSKILDAIFKAIDAIRSILTAIRDTGSEPNTDFSALIDSLKQITEQPTTPQLTNAEPELPDNEIEEALSTNIDTHAASFEFDHLFLSDQNTPEHHTPPPPSNENTDAKHDDPKAQKKNDHTHNLTESVRVRLSLLDKLMQIVSELVMTRNQLMQLNRGSDNKDPIKALYNTPIQRLNYITSELQENILKTRMQPISSIWATYPRVIRDIAQSLKKKIKLEMAGEDTEVDRYLIEAIKDPLVHMLRNSADHGVETPEERISKGKNPEGLVKLQAYHQSGQVVISISDDGKGIDTTRIKQKLIERVILSENQVAELSDQELYQYIFHPGFSTAASVTSVSGRGVGMDVVKTNIEKIGGVIELSSKLNYGSEFIIKIPLSLTIMPVLIVYYDKQKYAMPLNHIHEIIKIDQDSKHQIEFLNDSPILRIREQVLPLITLSDLFKSNRAEKPTKQFVIVCKTSSNLFGIVVDRVFDIEEIVVRPNSTPLRNTIVYTGSTILGDGSVAMIFDLISLYNMISSHAAYGESKYQEIDIISEHEEEYVCKFLLFQSSNNSIESVKAIPLDFITRLEEIETAKIEKVSGQYILQYRDSLMKLMSFDENENFLNKEIVEVIVFSNSGDILGLVVDEILDIVSHRFDSKVLKSHDPKYLSTVVINGKSTEIIDIAYLYKHSLKYVPKSVYVNNHKTITQPETHLLMVDDSAFFRKFIPPVLSSAGYKVSVADSVENALKLLDQHADISVVITDLQMPGLTGADLVKIIKEDERRSKIPVIALSAFNEEEASKRGQKLQLFDAYIPKTHQDKLVETINELVA